MLFQQITNDILNRQQKASDIQQSYLQMYDTLHNQKRKVEDLISDNYILYLGSSLTNSKHGLILDQQRFSLTKLKRIIKQRNRKYEKNNNFPLRLQFDIQIAPQIKDRFYLQNYSKQIQKQSSQLQTYDNLQLQQYLITMADQFCKFSLDCSFDFSKESKISKQDNTKLSHYLQKLGSCMKDLRVQIQNKKNKTLHEVSRGYRFIQMWNIQDQYLSQLFRQVEIFRENEGNIKTISKIYCKYNLFTQKEGLVQKIKRQKIQFEDNKYQKIYMSILLKLEDTQFLEKFLIQQEELQLLSFIKQYRQFFNQFRAFSFKDTENYNKSIFKWYSQRKREQSGSSGSYLHNIVSLLTLCDIDYSVPSYFCFDLCLYVLYLKIWKWSEVKMKQKQDEQKINQLMFSQFSKAQKYLANSNYPLEGISPTYKFLCLLMYEKSIKYLLFQKEGKIAVFIYMMLQSENIQKILASTRQQYRFSEIKCQLKNELKQLKIDETSIKFTVDILWVFQPYDQTQILLSSRAFVERVDWEYFLEAGDKDQRIEQLKIIIRKSIEIYKNAATFLNLGISLQFFQIQIIIQGLKSLLLLDVPLNEKEKSKFYGMISIFRGETIPPSAELSMLIMQMLVQWYILRESVIENDIKGLGLSLKCNLEQYEVLSQQYNILAESSKKSGTFRIHNIEYIKKIVSVNFVQALESSKQENQDLYIGYLYTMAESIVKIKISNQKIIKRSKIDLWTGNYIKKVDDCLKVVSGKFYKKLTALRDKSFNLFTLFSI